MVWWWIGFLIVTDMFFVFLAVSKIIKYWRIRMLQGRIRRLVDEVMTLEDLINDPGLRLDNVGLRSEDVDRIEDIVYNKAMIDLGKGNLDVCPICCEEFQEGNYVKALPVCKHIFHEKCVKEWLMMNPLCPMCRGNVRTNLGLTMDDWNEEFDLRIDERMTDLEANLLAPRVY
jgi:hypothetical protein